MNQEATELVGRDDSTGVGRYFELIPGKKDSDDIYLKFLSAIRGAMATVEVNHLQLEESVICDEDLMALAQYSLYGALENHKVAELLSWEFEPPAEWVR